MLQTINQSSWWQFWNLTAGYKCISNTSRDTGRWFILRSMFLKQSAFNVAWQMVNWSKMMSIQQIIEPWLDRRANIYQNLTLMSAPEIYTRSKCCHYQTQNFQPVRFYKITQSRSHQHQLLGLTDILDKPKIQMATI